VQQQVPLDWPTFDEEYGKAPPFVTGLDGRQLRFVGEVPKILSCLAAGRSPSRPAATVKGRPAAEVVQTAPAFRRQRPQQVKLSHETGGQQVWEVKAAQVGQVQDGQWSRRTYGLIWAKNVATGEEKYFLSNAPATAKVERLVQVGFRCWNVEHGSRLAKSELGFTHYEGRNYTALLRHQTLCLLMLTFVAEHTERLRGEKPGVDAGASLQRLEPGVRGVAGVEAGDEPPPAPRGYDRLPPGAEPSGAGVPPETPRHGKSAA
jgi:SRSO17 transposase